MKQRFSKRTRLVSALLTLAMIFTFLPFSAFAANTASTEIDFNSPDFKLNFPDEEFRRFLKECCDTNGDGKLDVDIKNMTIPTGYAITSLEGIRFFEDLEKLDCHGIGLTTLNVSKNFKLEELNCSDNQLKDYLYILSYRLKKLNCSNNKLTSMNLGILHGLNLEEVNCSNNNITNIVMDSVGELVKFDCSNNDLMTLDVSQCFKLEELNCSGNQLMELNVEGSKLLLCMSDLEAVRDTPEGLQFYAALLAYMNSSDFKPSTSLSVESFKNLFETGVRKEGIKVLDNISYE